MVSRQMRILAVDFGRKRVGIALSRSGSLVVPLAPHTMTTADALTAHLRTLIAAEGIERLVIGNGIVQPKLHAWLTAIQNGVPVPVEVVDEESSTNEAQQQVGTTQHHADSAAAAIILTRYLEEQ